MMDVNRVGSSVVSDMYTYLFFTTATIVVCWLPFEFRMLYLTLARSVVLYCRHTLEDELIVF